MELDRLGCLGQIKWMIKSIMNVWRESKTWGICKNEKDEEMTVQQLKYILKVEEVGSITEAAKLLFISQPSLSIPSKKRKKRLVSLFFSAVESELLWQKMVLNFSVMLVRWYSRWNCWRIGMLQIFRGNCYKRRKGTTDQNVDKSQWDRGRRRRCKTGTVRMCD